MPTAADLGELLRQLAALAGDAEPPRVVIERDGWRVELSAGAAADVRLAAAPVSEMETNVLEALGADTLTGQQIADRAGYPLDKDLKSCLPSMRRRGVLTGNRGDVGYAAADPAGGGRQARAKGPRHSADFRSVHWFGVDYTFTPTQAAVVKQLWEAWEDGTPDMSQETLTEAAGSERDRMRDLFRDHPAWQALVVSRAKDTFRLNERKDDA